MAKKNQVLFLEPDRAESFVLGGGSNRPAFTPGKSVNSFLLTWCVWNHFRLKNPVIIKRARSCIMLSQVPGKLFLMEKNMT